MSGPLRTIRAKLRTNVLPSTTPLRARVTEGYGQDCSACDFPMDGGPVWEVEFPGGQLIRLHAECEMYWRRETGN
jgi:hypothetical protein